MNRILHIFRKDAIRRWPQVLVFLAMLAANVSIERWYPHDAPSVTRAMVAGTVAVLAVQYWRRDTQLCRLFLVATFLLSLFPSLPFGVEWAVEELSSPQRMDAASGRIALDPQRARTPWPPPAWPHYRSFVWLEVPVRFERLPSGSMIEAIAVKTRAQTSTTYDSKLGWLLADDSQPGWLPTEFHEVEDGAGFVSIYVTPDFYSTAYRRPVHLYGTLDLMVFHRAQTVGLPGRRSVDVPGIGQCASQPGTTNVTICNTIQPSSRIQILSNGRPAGHPEANSPNILAPFPERGDYSPLTPFKVTVPPDLLYYAGPIQLEIQRPIAYIHRTFDFQNIRLDDYIMPPPAETARH